MPDVSWNRNTWGSVGSWSQGGEEWSAPWGNSEAQWFGSLYPRLHRVLPARAILEIAPGMGRWARFLLPFCERYVGVDLSTLCVEHCRRELSSYKHAHFIQNDGYSL